MTKVIAINGRGTLTLPTELRKLLGLTTPGQVVAEETAEGILLRPGVTVPLELYSPKRIAEFQKSDTELAPLMGLLRKKTGRTIRK